MACDVKLKGLSVTGGDALLHLMATVTNISARVISPGGLRGLASNSSGFPIKLSLPNLWPLNPGESITLTAHVPGSALGLIRTLFAFEYVDMSGQSHPIQGDVRIGMLGGAKIENAG